MTIYHPPSAANIMSHSYWDDLTIRSIVQNFIPSPEPDWSPDCILYELQIDGVTCDLHPFKSVVEKAMNKSSRICKIYRINQVSGKKELVKEVDRRHTNIKEIQKRWSLMLEVQRRKTA